MGAELANRLMARRRPTANAPGGSFGDVIEALKEEGHLNQRQWNAGQLLVALLQAHGGSSAGIVSTTRDKVDVSTIAPLWPPGGPGGDAVGALMKDLRHHERDLYRFLATHRELPRGTLADWARTRSAYRTGKTQRAMAVGRITAMLDSIAEIAFQKAA